MEAPAMTAGTIAQTAARPRLVRATTALLATFAAGLLAGAIAAPGIHVFGVPAAPIARDSAAAFQLYLRGEADSYGSPAAPPAHRAYLLFLRGETDSYRP
jgi:hypothetical protein